MSNRRSREWTFDAIERQMVGRWCHLSAQGPGDPCAKIESTSIYQSACGSKVSLFLSLNMDISVDSQIVSIWFLWQKNMNPPAFYIELEQFCVLMTEEPDLVINQLFWRSLGSFLALRVSKIRFLMYCMPWFIIHGGQAIMLCGVNRLFSRMEWIGTVQLSRYSVSPAPDPHLVSHSEISLWRRSNASFLCHLPRI